MTLPTAVQNDKSLTDENKQEMLLILRTELRSCLVRFKQKDLDSNQSSYQELVKPNGLVARTVALHGITDPPQGWGSTPTSEEGRIYRYAHSLVQKASQSIQENERAIRHQPQPQGKYDNVDVSQKDNIVTLERINDVNSIHSFIEINDTNNLSCHSSLENASRRRTSESKIPETQRKETGSVQTRAAQQKKAAEEDTGPNQCRKSQSRKRRERKAAKIWFRRQEANEKVTSRVNDLISDKINVRSINKLNNIILPKEIELWLSSGTKFIPTLKCKPKQTDLQLNDCLRQITTHVIKYNQSLEIPRTLDFTKLTDFVKNLYTSKIHDLHRVFHDSDEAMITKIKKYCFENKLIIQPADKNQGLTAMTKEWYIECIESMLNDKENYTIQSPDLNSIRYTILSMLEQYKYRGPIAGACNRDLRGYYERRQSSTYKLPYFQGLPKIHKTPITFRPIIPNVDWITTKLSQYMSKWLTAIMKAYPWVILNSSDCLTTLGESQFFHSEKTLLITADVVSLYTNIDIREGIDTVCQLLSDNIDLYDDQIYPEDIPFFKDSLSIILDNNYFQFGNTTFRQIKGTAMGTNMAPAYANLFMVAHELKWRKSPLFPKTYFRYLDDIFYIIEPEHHEGFAALISNSTPSLKFTFNQSMDHAIFLDLTIFKGNRYATTFTLDHKTYQKETDKKLFILPTSFHPTNQKLSWLTGENIRHLRNNSDEASFTNIMKEFKISLREREYDAETIVKYQKHRYHDRIRFLQRTVKRQCKSKFIYTPNTASRTVLENIIPKINKFICQMTGFNDLKFSTIYTRGQSIFDISRSSNRSCLGPEIFIGIPTSNVTHPDVISESSRSTTSSNATNFKHSTPKHILNQSRITPNKRTATTASSYSPEFLAQVKMLSDRAASEKKAKLDAKLTSEKKEADDKEKAAAAQPKITSMFKKR